MKKLSFIVLVIILFCMVISSCSNNDLDTTSQSDTTETVGEEITDFDYTAYIEPVDYNQYDFKLLVKPEDINNFRDITRDELNGEVLNDEIFNRNKILESKYNITISTIISSAFAKDIAATVMADDNAYDAACPATSVAFNSGLEGYLMDLNQIPHLDFEKPWWRSSIINDTSVANINYFAIGDINLLSHQKLYVMFFNKNMKEEYLTESIYNIVFDGMWTLDKLKKFSQTVSADLDGDGDFTPADMYGLGINSAAALSFTSASSTHFINKDTDDLPILDLYQVRFINFFQDFFNIVSDQSTLYGEKYGSERTSVLNTAFKEDRMLFYVETMTFISTLRDMDTDYGIIPIPKYDESQENYEMFTHATASTVISVLITNDNLERTGRIIEDMACYSYYTTRPAYIETVLQTKYTRDEESSKIISIILDSMKLDLAQILDGNLGLTTVLRSVPENISSEFAVKESAFQAYIDNMIQQILAQSEK